MARKKGGLHGPEAAVLPGHPLLGDGIVVRVDGEAEPVLRVVVAREVGQDGDALEDGEPAAVVVDDGGDAAVGVERRVPGLLLRLLGDVDALDGVFGPVGCLQLFEEDRDFVAVRCSCRSLDWRYEKQGASSVN